LCIIILLPRRAIIPAKIVRPASARKKFAPSARRIFGFASPAAAARSAEDGLPAGFFVLF
jgi:hypothetical protein